MSGFKLSEADERKLVGVHPDLARVVRHSAVAAPLRFRVLEGVRPLARQRTLLKQGATKTLNSRHLTGHAVDLAPIYNGAVSWHWPHYYPLAAHIKKSAAILGVAVDWGGDWRTFKDGPHWELRWSVYPK